MRYEKADFKAAYGTFNQLPESNAPEIAFAGRSNVGKSLFNRELLPTFDLPANAISGAFDSGN